jgi:hypothetical protein
MKMGRSAVVFAICFAVVAMDARGGEGEPEKSVDYEAAWVTLNDTSASFESRIKAESDLLKARYAENLEFVLESVFADIRVTTPEGVKSLPYMDARQAQGDGPFLALGGPGNSLHADEGFTPARQVAYSRERVLIRLIKYSEPGHLRKEIFADLFERAVSTSVGDHIGKDAAYPQELKEWLVRSLLYSGISRNWSLDMPSLLLKVSEDATLPDSMRRDSVSRIRNFARGYPVEKSQKLAFDEKLDAAYRARRQQTTYQAMPLISMVRGPKVSVLVADWVISIDAERCDSERLWRVADRFHWHFPDALPQQTTLKQVDELSRRWHDPPVELIQEANRTGDWSSVEAYKDQVQIETRDLLIEQHQEMVEWASKALPDLESEAELEL